MCVKCVGTEASSSGLTQGALLEGELVQDEVERLVADGLVDSTKARRLDEALAILVHPLEHQAVVRIGRFVCDIFETEFIIDLDICVDHKMAVVGPFGREFLLMG